MAKIPNKIYIDSSFVTEQESNPGIASIPQNDRVDLDGYINQQIQSGEIVASGGTSAPIANNTIAGNISGATAAATGLTPTQVKTLLSIPDVIYQNEGTALGTAGTTTTINITGDGATASRVGNVVTVDVPGGGAPSRVQSNNADIKYWVATGTPVVTFTQAGGIGTINSVGGTIELNRVQVNVIVGTDTEAGNFYTVVAPTTQSGTFLQYPTTNILNTGNGAAPSGVAAHLVRNPGSTPVVTYTAGTAGTSITMKTGDLSVVGTTASIVMNF